MTVNKIKTVMAESIVNAMYSCVRITGPYFILLVRRLGLISHVTFSTPTQDQQP
jgi:hypothetical protein